MSPSLSLRSTNRSYLSCAPSPSISPLSSPYLNTLQLELALPSKLGQIQPVKAKLIQMFGVD